MRKLITTSILVIATLFVSNIHAQVKTPAASPAAKVEQAVGLTDVTIEYSRPSKRGRAIFGNLVPYGKIWRTGANGATKITFSKDVTIQGEALEMGSYAVLTVPNEGSWDVMFYKFTERGFGGYVEKDPDLKVSAEATVLPMVAAESFTIGIDNLTNDGASIDILWDNVWVSLALGVHTDKAVMANIDRVMSGPSQNDFYAAGVYLYQNGKDVMKALEYVQKGVNTESPKFWQQKWLAEVMMAAGKKKDAIKTAQKSIELAEAAGNSDYVKMNKDNIAKWKSM